MKTRLVLSAVFIVALATLGYALLTQPHAAPAATSTQSSPTDAQTSAASSTAYTMAQVAEHNSASSCWSAINGKVYDLTQWIGEHPGGPEHIIPLCGTDGSAAFNAQHGSQGAPAQALAQMYIGELAQ